MLLLAATTIIEQFSLAFEALGAGWVMWLLLGLSIVSVAVMIERVLYFATHSTGDIEDIARLLQNGELEKAAQAVADKRGLEAEVVRQGVESVQYGTATVERVIEKAIAEERLKYGRFLAYLGTLGNNAPFVGLFGTVLGIIQAFAELAKNAKAGTMTSGGGNIMAGISEALVATAVGLLVALPAVALNNVFARWLKNITDRGEVLGKALTAYLERAPTDERGPEKVSHDKPEKAEKKEKSAEKSEKKEPGPVALPRPAANEK